jgi:hypothetical protein
MEKKIGRTEREGERRTKEGLPHMKIQMRKKLQISYK